MCLKGRFYKGYANAFFVTRILIGIPNNLSKLLAIFSVISKQFIRDLIAIL